MKWLNDIRHSSFLRLPRRPLVGIFLFATVGIAAADWWPVEPWIPLPAFLALALLLCVRPSNWATLVFVAAAFFLIHDFRVLENPGKRLAREFSDKPLAVKAAGIVISRPDPRPATRNIPACRFRMRLESIESEGRNVALDARVMATWIGEPPSYGDRVSITGEASNVPAPRNPGQFDYRNYLNRLGFYSEIRMRYPNDGEILDGGHGNPVVAFAISTHRWMQDKLRLDLENSPAVAGLLQGMVLGEKDETPSDIKDLFQRTGTLHLFVVNGLHIGMFSVIVFMLVRLLGAGRRLSVAIVIPLIFFYALLTGLSPGSIRASIMAAVLLSGRIFDRKPIIMNNLAAAGLAILIVNTNELFMPGFQFSMGVVFAIILLAGRLQRFFARFGTPDSFLPRSLWSKSQTATYFCWNHFSSLLGVSTAASIGSTPFTAGYFNLLTPSSIMANLVIVPVAFLLLVEGLLSVIAGLFSNVLAAIFNNAAWPLAHLILWEVQMFAHIPAGHFYIEKPSFKAAQSCEITIFDFSSGGAIHVRSGGHDWMIDCGSTVTYDNIVQPYLCSRGVNRLDALLLSRGGSNSIGGAAALMMDFHPANIAGLPPDNRSKAQRDLTRLLREKGLTRGDCKQGDVLKISDSAILRVLYAPEKSNMRTADDKMLMLRLECGGRRILFVPGGNPRVERWLLENGRDLRSDILFAYPHSLDNSDSMNFINAVQPRLVICAAPEIPQGTPMDENRALELKRRGIRLFRQEQTGAVRIQLNNDHYSARSFVGNQAFLSNNR